MAIESALASNVDRANIRAQLVKSLGDGIRGARTSSHLTQEQLAEIIGVDPVSVRRWELGIRMPGLIDLEIIATALGLPAVTDILAPEVWKIPT
jgi:transcriptional regulator with XRE-family HTH domain